MAALSKRQRVEWALLIGENSPSSVNQLSDLSHLPTLEPPTPVNGKAFVYIIACSDGSIYVGRASDVTKRLAEHGGPKGAKFTRDHQGGRLIHVEGPLSTALAAQRERQLKRWSRAKKLALIRDQVELLKKLSHSTRCCLLTAGHSTQSWLYP
jgi:putative endonuclease